LSARGSEEELAGRGRGASIVSWFLIGFGALVLVFANVAQRVGPGWGLAFFLVVVALTLITVGLVVWPKSLGRGKGTPEGLSRLVRRSLILGVSMFALGVVMILVVGVVVPYAEQDLPFLFSIGLIAGGGNCFGDRGRQVPMEHHEQAICSPAANHGCIPGD